jgi:hypothetical protein
MTVTENISEYTSLLQHEDSNREVLRYSKEFVCDQEAFQQQEDEGLSQQEIRRYCRFICDYILNSGQEQCCSNAFVP